MKFSKIRSEICKIAEQFDIYEDDIDINIEKIEPKILGIDQNAVVVVEVTEWKNVDKIGATKLNYRCADCKSLDLSYPSHSIWSYNKQEYISDEVYYSEGSCINCDEDSSVEEITLTHTDKGWEITNITVLNDKQ